MLDNKGVLGLSQIGHRFNNSGSNSNSNSNSNSIGGGNNVPFFELLWIVVIFCACRVECNVVIINFGNVATTYKIPSLPRLSYYDYDESSTTEYNVDRYYDWSNFRLLNISFYPSSNYYVQTSSNIPVEDLAIGLLPRRLDGEYYFFVYYVYDDDGGDLSKTTLKRLNLVTMEDSDFIVNFNCLRSLRTGCSNVLNFKIRQDNVLNVTFLQMLGVNVLATGVYEPVFYEVDIKTLNASNNNFGNIQWSKKLYMSYRFSGMSYEFLIIQNHSIINTSTTTCTNNINNCIYNNTKILRLTTMGDSFLYNNDSSVSKKYPIESAATTTLDSFISVGSKEGTYTINMAYKNNFVFTFLYSKQFSNSWTLYFLDTQKMSTFDILCDNITLGDVTFPSWIITNLVLDPIQENTFYVFAYFTNYSQYTNGVMTTTTLIKIIRFTLSYSGSLFDNTLIQSSIKMSSQKTIIQKHVPLFIRPKFDILPDPIINAYINHQYTSSSQQQPPNGQITSNSISITNASTFTILLFVAIYNFYHLCL